MINGIIPIWSFLLKNIAIKAICFMPGRLRLVLKFGIKKKTIFHYHIWRLEFDETLLLKKYLYYFLLNEVEAIKSSPTTTKSTMMHISMKEMKKRMVPVPPIEVQQRIVDILDKFDALVNDISQGLPAEIEARRKQYEYYRDKLLTFKEKVN